MEELHTHQVNERVTVQVEEVEMMDQEDQKDLVDLVDLQMTLVIGVQIQMHTGIQGMDGLQFEDLMEKEMDQDQLDEMQHRFWNLTNKRTGLTKKLKLTLRNQILLTEQTNGNGNPSSYKCKGPSLQNQ